MSQKQTLILCYAGIALGMLAMLGYLVQVIVESSLFK